MIESIVHMGGVWYGVRRLHDGLWQVVYSEYDGPWMPSGEHATRAAAVECACRYCTP
jgi:hypothetical protein